MNLFRQRVFLVIHARKTEEVDSFLAPVAGYGETHYGEVAPIRDYLANMDHNPQENDFTLMACGANNRCAETLGFILGVVNKNPLKEVKEVFRLTERDDLSGVGSFIHVTRIIITDYLGTEVSRLAKKNGTIVYKPSVDVEIPEKNWEDCFDGLNVHKFIKRQLRKTKGNILLSGVKRFAEKFPLHSSCGRIKSSSLYEIKGLSHGERMWIEPILMKED